MKIGNISTATLLSTKRESLGLIAFGLYSCVVRLAMTGAVDYPNLIMGLTFIACAIIVATPSPRVLSGVLVGFMGVVNLLSISNVFPIDTAWQITVLCIVGVLALEYMKFGKASKQSRYAIVIPMLSLFFMFVLVFVGYNPVLSVDWATQQIKAINYVALMFLTGIVSLKYLGWNLPKKNQGMWIAALAGLAIVTSFWGAYQGTLAW